MHFLRRRRLRVGSPLSAELERELDAEPRWMYPWRLGNVTAPVLGDELESVHRTRRELIESPVRAHLHAAGASACAVDLACNEGYFSHWLVESGARRVVGIDVRDVHVRRARLVRDQLGLDPGTLSFEQHDVFDLPLERLGRFDVVLVLGLVYHVEDPVGAIRAARSLTAQGGVCVVESQLTRQHEPIVNGWGLTDYFEDAEASFAARFEPEQDSNPLASWGGSLSLVPNRAALDLSMRVAGFRDVVFLEPKPHHNPQFVAGDRAVVIGRALG